jgi:hypothetical protein
MSDQEKVVEQLKELRSHFRALAGITSSSESRKNYVESARTIDEAIELLKEQEPMTVNERRDLEILRRVKSGKILKHGCADYVIYNGEWYRKNPWNHPQESVKPVWHENDKSIGYFECGACGANMGTNPNYCWYCGKKVKLDE